MVQKRIITKYSFWFGKLMQCVILNERLQKFVDVRIMSFVVEYYDENGELCCLFLYVGDDEREKKKRFSLREI